MANRVLFVSSVAVGLLHAILLFLQDHLPHVVLTCTIVCGVATSIWNHGVSSSIAQVMDRGMMWVGFLLDLHFVWQAPDWETSCYCSTTLLAAAALYFLAKLWLRGLSSEELVTQCLVKSLEHELVHHSALSKRKRRELLANASHVGAHLALTVTHALLLRASTVLLDEVAISH